MPEMAKYAAKRDHGQEKTMQNTTSGVVSPHVRRLGARDDAAAEPSPSVARRLTVGEVSPSQIVFPFVNLTTRNQHSATLLSSQL